MVTRTEARDRLLAELAGPPARRAYGIACDLLGNRAEAEEAVQEGLVRACEAIAELRDPVAAPAWFLRIVTTMCLRTLRRRRLKRRLLGWMPGGGRDAMELTPATVVADTGIADIAGRMHATERPIPREALEEHQTLGALLERLGERSAQQRTALVLRYGHDLPVAEVASLLGVELATAKTHLVRGLARLRTLMEEHR